MQEADLFREVLDISPADAAARIRQIADALERGEIELGAQTFTLPENVTINIELEERHDGDLPAVNFEIEFEIAWPVRMRQVEQ